MLGAGRHPSSGYTDLSAASTITVGDPDAHACIWASKGSNIDCNPILKVGIEAGARAEFLESVVFASRGSLKNNLICRMGVVEFEVDLPRGFLDVGEVEAACYGRSRAPQNGLTTCNSGTP